MSPERIPEEIRDRVRRQAGERCGYCLSQQKYVLGLLEIEHIIPKAKGGGDEEENLWLACRMCNAYKGVQILVRRLVRHHFWFLALMPIKMITLPAATTNSLI